MREVIIMISNQRVIIFITLFLVLSHIIHPKTLSNKAPTDKEKDKKPKQESKTDENNKDTENNNTTPPVKEEEEEDDDDDSSDDDKDPSTTNSPKKEEQPKTDETADNDDENDENEDNNQKSVEEEEPKPNNKIVKNVKTPTSNKPKKVPNTQKVGGNTQGASHVYGENDEEDDSIAQTTRAPKRISTTRKPSKMVPTGSWTLACPNPCSQVCAPSCTPQCCESHFSMTAPVPTSDELPPSLPVNIPPTNVPQLPPPMPNNGQMLPPSPCPSFCNNNPSCDSVCQPSCCSLQSLQTFLNTAATVMNPTCPPQCNDKNCNPMTCPGICCTTTIKTGQDMPPSMDSTSMDSTVSCPPECMNYGSRCTSMCRSECCTPPFVDQLQSTESIKVPSKTKSKSDQESDDIDQAIAQGRMKCPDYCNSTECLSRCPIICC